MAETSPISAPLITVPEGTQLPALGIAVNGDASKDVLEAFIRQAITVLGVALGAVGLTKAAGMASALLVVAGPLASLIAMGWGLWKTHTIASKAAAMAKLLPNPVATTK